MLVLALCAREGAAIAQDTGLDTLHQVMAAARGTSGEAQACLDLGAAYQRIDTDTADHYLERAVLLARRTGQRLVLANALRQQGWTRYLTSAYDSAQVLYDASNAELEQLLSDPGTDAALRRQALGAKAANARNIGVLFDARSNYPEALKRYFEALKLYEELQDAPGMAKVYGSIGVTYTDTREHDLALWNFRRSIAINDSIGRPNDNRGNLVNLGNLHYARQEPELALDSYQRAIAISRRLDDARAMAAVLGNIATIHADQGRLDSALACHAEARAVSARVGNRRVEAINVLNIAGIRRKQGKTALAKAGYREGLALGESIGALDLMRDAHLSLSELLSLDGQHDEALGHYRQHIALRDSITNDENRKEEMRQQLQYDYDKKEALLVAEQEKRDAVAAEELRRRNLQRNAFIGGFVLMLALAGTFLFQRNRINKEKARSEELLLNILPEEVANELKEKGEAEAKLIEQVTVLFTDFKGFTAMSEELGPKELVRDLHDCFSAFDRICEEHGLEKIKTIGDAYMAAGGLPTPNSSHAVDAINAALAMRDFIADGKARKIAEGLPYFEIRIGIHTGPVVAGIVGVKKFSYDIWGDTVNTASRMESSGEVGMVNVSASTFQLVHEAMVVEGDVDPDNAEAPARHSSGFIFTPRGNVQAKGKGEMEMYFVESSATHQG
jgi:class 3 adenylate cyclase/tetratricopeptide (TPR) repeat protein